MMVNSSTAAESSCSDGHQYLLTCVLSSSILLLLILLGAFGLRKYCLLVRTVQELRGNQLFFSAARLQEAPVTPVSTGQAANQDEEEAMTTHTLLQQNSTIRTSSRKLWRGLQQAPRFTKSDLDLLQLIKAGKEGVFYQARMTRGTCKGHNMFTCKISKEGVRQRHMDLEVSIMRKLVHHKNILQLLDWNTTEEPYVLIMEYVSYGTLRTFLQTNRVRLSSDPELQSLLTIASHQVAQAMQHLCSKMVLHCDLALRNIMVNKFPWEIKVAEFGLARDVTRVTSRHGSRWKNPRHRVPLRWYPPEFFKNNFYSFKGDVWAFGIVMWEMQTFGTLPYPHLETSEAVMYHICIGQKNSNPEGCRPEILHIMRDCWLEPHTLRPSFTDIVHLLENVMETDADYVDVEGSRLHEKENPEYQQAKGLRTSSATLEDKANI
ncbi:fibroblast growth factor receptor homolog 1 [Genypterus blacodes]|uniref:fibroblast growth factor receptor homolog 1 n=1 Tax=Genypterus blacodes TaxID=154954 RepID=UPI003F7722C4